MDPAEPLKAYRDQQHEIEKMLDYHYHDKERERSNRAAGMHELAAGTRRRCPLRHQRIAWSGPPHDSVRYYVCLECNAAASEPEIKHLGYEFDTVPDLVIHSILDMDLGRQSVVPRVFGGVSLPE
jgi:hypothetical protein